MSQNRHNSTRLGFGAGQTSPSNLPAVPFSTLAAASCAVRAGYHPAIRHLATTVHIWLARGNATLATDQPEVFHEQ